MTSGKLVATVAALVAATIGLTAVPAFAAEPKPQPLIGAEPTEPCAWPTAGYGTFSAPPFAGASCGVTLIHPQVVAVYGECVYPIVDGVVFGDDLINGPFQEVEPLSGLAEDSCVLHPNGYLAVCVLAEPVDLPINPIVYGCERGIVEAGREVVMAGFGGEQYSPPAGTSPIKHWGSNTITSVSNLDIVVSPTEGPIGCGPADLGSPLFVEYPDGSWHLLGIARETADCAEWTTYLRLDTVVPWIEDTLTVDVTPCHDVDGTWAPTELCADVPNGGPDGAGTWEDWCSGTPTLERSETCGPGFGASPEQAAPVVVIDSPPDQATFASGEEFAIEIAVNHPVVGVAISIDGMLQPPTDASWPYAFSPVQLPDGVYTFVAVAEGEDGVTRESAAIQIHVGSEGSETGSETTGDELADDETGDSTGLDGETCACRTNSSRPAGAWWSVLSILICVRSSRRRRGRRS